MIQKRENNTEATEQLQDLDHVRWAVILLDNRGLPLCGVRYPHSQHDWLIVCATEVRIQHGDPCLLPSGNVPN